MQEPIWTVKQFDTQTGKTEVIGLAWQEFENAKGYCAHAARLGRQRYRYSVDIRPLIGRRPSPPPDLHENPLQIPSAEELFGASPF